MNKILVTGGAGFIGSHLTARLVAEGYDITVVDNLSSGKKGNVPRGAKLHVMDIRDANAMNKLFATHHFDVMFHQAAQMSVLRSMKDPLYDADVNVKGLITLMEAGRKNGLRKVVFASSGGVIYGEPVHTPQHEDHPLAPMSPYGISKMASEKYLHFYWKVYGIPTVSLRYANVYGPRQNPQSGAGVIAMMLEKILTGKQTKINGDGTKTRDYVHVDDVITANLYALECDGPDTFNIGTSFMPCFS